MKRKGRKAEQSVTQLERAIVKAEQSLEDQLSNIQDRDLAKVSPKTLYSLRDKFKKHAERGVNVGYLQTVLFPEQFTYELPIPLSSISYCKFTNKSELVISSGPLGQGVLVWYPRTVFGPQLFLYYPDDGTISSTKICYTKSLPTTGPISFSDQFAALASGANAGKLFRYWRPLLDTYQNQYFTQAALVGGSLTVQYIGSVENEAGMMVGGHIYGVPIGNLLIDDIENAQWLVRGRPGDGARFLYLPKDATDFDFYPIIPTSSGNAGANNASTTDLDVVYYRATASASANVTSFMAQDGSGVWSPNGTTQMLDQGTTAVQASIVAGTPGTASYVKNNDYVALYWSGIKPNENCLRVDTIRKFCGIPNQSTRDIVELQRPSRNYDSQKTSQVLNMMGSVAPIGGHTLKEIDKVMDQFINVLPNAGYILDQGGLDISNGSLQDLVSALSLSEQTSGPPVGMNKNLYKYYL